MNKQRFLSLVDVLEDGCWRQRKHRGQRCDQTPCEYTTGYGSHRRAWRLFYGEIPKRRCICHTCDNPPCCNLEHLFLSTYVGNMKDCRQKGRSARGEKNGGAKLTEEQVKEVRERYDGRYGCMKQLAMEFGISEGGIRNIVRGKNWMEEGQEVEWTSRCDMNAPRSSRPQEVKERIRQSLKGRKRPKEVVERIQATKRRKRLELRQL